MSNTNTAQKAVYEAWKDYQSEGADTSQERFEEAYIGEFYGYEALGEYLINDSGMADLDYITSKIDDSLAPYFKFDYGMYGRDLDYSGDVYTVDTFRPMGTAGHQIRSTHYFWTNV
jgi:antirestriction protein